MARASDTKRLVQPGITEICNILKTKKTNDVMKQIPVNFTVSFRACDRIASVNGDI